jgi:hypothetical protein
LRNMTVLPHPVAPGQDDAFVAKALQVRRWDLAGCDKIAHESKPLRSAAWQMLFTLRSIVLFCSSIAASRCVLRTSDICASWSSARNRS